MSPAGSFAVSRLLQYQNTLLSIVSTVSGISMLMRLVQPSKAPSPMLVTVEAICTSVTSDRPEKA